MTAVMPEARRQRIVVFAYSEVGHACLEALLDRRENVVALFTHEDAEDERLWFRSCAHLARVHDVPVYKMEPRGEEFERLVRELAPDLIFSFYYRKMIPERVLALAPLGAYNMHGSLLPRYRGRAPLNWAIVHGESETGVTLHLMVKEADAGDIVDRERVPIGPDESAGEVAMRIPGAAVKLILRRIDELKAGRAPRRPQDAMQASYFGRRRPEDGHIDWRRPAREIFNLVRAVAPPFPGAFTSLSGRKLMIWRAHMAPGTGRPGEVLSLSPLRIAAGEGAIDAVHFGFEDENETEPSPRVLAALCAGDVLGERA